MTYKDTGFLRKTNIENYESFIEALTDISPVQISYKPFSDKSTKGYYCEKDHEIVVQTGMSEMHTIKTLIHEVAHSLLHTQAQLNELPRDSQQIEVEAESIAFVVCTRFNIPVDDYSFPYILHWSRGEGEKRVMQSMKTIQDTAARIITGINQHFENRLSVNTA